MEGIQNFFPSFVRISQTHKFGYFGYASTTFTHTHKRSALFHRFAGVQKNEDISYTYQSKFDPESRSGDKEGGM